MGMTPTRCPPENWELHPSQVLVETRLGHGTFGDVFKGMVRGGVGLYKSNGPLRLNHVAIKLLRSESHDELVYTCAFQGFLIDTLDLFHYATHVPSISFL